MKRSINATCGLLVSTFFLGGLLFAAPQTEKKFTFDGAQEKHPVTLELESVVYKAKGADLKFKVTNNSKSGIDFSRANWKFLYGNTNGYIKESDFDGLVMHPNSKRIAKISFFTESVHKPGFLHERAKGTSQIEIDNILTFEKKKLPKIKMKNY